MSSEINKNNTEDSIVLEVKENNVKNDNSEVNKTKNNEDNSNINKNNESEIKEKENKNINIKLKITNNRKNIYGNKHEEEKNNEAKKDNQLSQTKKIEKEKELLEKREKEIEESYKNLEEREKELEEKIKKLENAKSAYIKELKKCIEKYKEKCETEKKLKLEYENQIKYLKQKHEIEIRYYKKSKLLELKKEKKINDSKIYESKSKEKGNNSNQSLNKKGNPKKEVSREKNLNLKESKEEEKEEEDKEEGEEEQKSKKFEPKGLENLGLSCYMNSILQCLFYIPELRNYFIEEKENFDEDEQKVCKAFSDVMYKLKNYKKAIKADKFKKAMGEKNNLFEGKKAGDAKDLFFNIIDSLLVELNDEITNLNGGESNEEEENDDIKDPKQLFEQCKNEVDEENIINKLFIGYYETIYECSKTEGEKTYSFQNESFLLFELVKIKKYFNKENLTLDECFSYFYRKQKNSSFFCSKCKDVEISECKEVIYRPPEILVIILDRGKGKSFKGKVDFNKYLDLVNCIKEEDYKYSSLYQLIGVSTHSGESSSSGHYTARCLTDNGLYYYFSDEKVLKIKNDEELFEDEPYILFYKKIDKNKINENIEKNIDKINPEIEPPPIEEREEEKNKEMHDKTNSVNTTQNKKRKRRRNNEDSNQYDNDKNNNNKNNNNNNVNNNKNNNNYNNNNQAKGSCKTGEKELLENNKKNKKSKKRKKK